MSNPVLPPLVPVMHRDALGFPEHEPRGEYDRAPYVNVSEALSFCFDKDFHFAGYSLPSIERRLATVAALDYQPEMVLFIVDVEPEGHAPATPEWRDSESKKISKLFEDIPGGFQYNTRGGYRLVYALPEPFVLRTREDTKRWKDSYLKWLDFLKGEYEITGDTNCSDWTRIFRAPFVIRDGEPQKPETKGDPENIGTWTIALAASTPTMALVTVADVKDVDNYLEAAKLLGEVWPASGRHKAQLALSGALARAGWSVENIGDFCALVADIQDPGNADLPKRLKTARSSVDKVTSGMSVQGWPTLEPIIGPECLAQVTALLGIAKAPEPDEDFRAKAAQWVNLEPPPEQAWRAAQEKYRSKNTEERDGAQLLKRLFKGQPLADKPDELDNALGRLVFAMIKIAPKATNLQVAEQLVRSVFKYSTDQLVHIVDEGRKVVDQQERANQAPDEFFLGKDGSPQRDCAHNFRVGLHRLRIQMRFDEFAQKKLIQYGDDSKRTILQDHHIIRIMFQMEKDFSFSPLKDKFFDFCGDLARENSFHPVRDYLDGLGEWDKVPRLDTWLIDYAGAKDTPYIRAVSRLVLIAAVRRIRHPGCKFDEMLIIEGKQGCWKSEALRALCGNPDWFTDDLPLGVDTKVVIEKTAGKWIVEAPELKGMTQKTHNDLKSFLSRPRDEARMAYGREPQVADRQFIVIASTNDRQYLSDPTGDRRYWPVWVEQFDVEGLKIIKDKLWTEASHYEALGESIRLDPSLYATAGIEQTQRKLDDPDKIVLEELLGHLEGQILVREVWRLLGFENDVPNRSRQIGITNAMKSFGWEIADKRVDKVRVKVYEKGPNPTSLKVSGSITFGFKIAQEGAQAPN